MGAMLPSPYTRGSFTTEAVLTPCHAPRAGLGGQLCRAVSGGMVAAGAGLSRMLDLHATHLSTQTFGTIPYMPPELLRAGVMSRKADIFSFAVIMWQLFVGQSPHDGMPSMQVTLPRSQMPIRGHRRSSCVHDWRSEPELLQSSRCLRFF